LLDPLARGALPRLRAFRRRRRGRTGAWVGSGERQIDVWFPPTFAHTRTHTHTHTHTHRSTEIQRTACGGAWLASTRVARGIAPTCVRKSTALRLSVGVRLDRPLRCTQAPAGKRMAQREGRLASTRDSAHNTRHRGAASPGMRQQRVAGVRFTLALGCARAQPAPSPSFATQEHHNTKSGPQEPKA
jgi:hypothetical protein